MSCMTLFFNTCRYSVLTSKACLFINLFKIKSLHWICRLLEALAWQRPILAGSDPPTTFGVLKLNCCVRHGNRCILQAIITTLPSRVRACALKTKQYLIPPTNLTASAWLSPRPISNGPLHASLHFHFHPIYHIISVGSYFHKGMGNLILRRVSHLDAFSVYLIHT